MDEFRNKRVSRREFLRGAAAVLALPMVVHSATRTDKRPNIILFITDDQDKHSIGAYGGDSLTPNLDRLAREGMVFHQAYVSSTV
ncbi:MAG: sulfatase-like hydrolase/transferase, partial [Planctomycetota bacterium]